MKLKKEDFLKLDENNMPEPNVVVWCMRKNGGVILAFRSGNPIAPSGSSPWNNCHWKAFSLDDGSLITELGRLEYSTSFSDVTVDSWAPFNQPPVVALCEMNHYHTAMSELFKQAAMHRDLTATGILAKLLELTTEPAKALAYWNNNKHQLASMSDTLTLQEITEYLEEVK